MSDDIRWNKDRHDKAVSALQQEEARKKVMPQIVKTYEAWKRRFVKKSKTQPEVIQDLYRLRDMMGDVTKHTPGMEAFREFTMNMIDDKITDVVNTACGTKNVFNERAVETASGSASIPEFHYFETQEELEAIPFLKKHKERDGFVGLLRSGRIIHAWYDHGEIVLCGYCLTMVGLEKLPTIDQVRKALKEKPSGADNDAV